MNKNLKRCKQIYNILMYMMKMLKIKKYLVFNRYINNVNYNLLLNNNYDEMLKLFNIKIIQMMIYKLFFLLLLKKFIKIGKVFLIRKFLKIKLK